MNQEHVTDLIHRPKWTADPPTAPGLYWFALIDSRHGRRFCHVFEKDGRLFVRLNDGDLHVEQLHRVWAGPLLEPAETYCEARKW